jgi:hypothetical protein
LDQDLGKLSLEEKSSLDSNKVYDKDKGFFGLRFKYYKPEVKKEIRHFRLKKH